MQFLDIDKLKTDYLVVFAAHINTEEKLNTAIRHLELMRNEGIDVCLSINSNRYFDTLSEYAKYFVYDSNNQGIMPYDFLANAECVNIHRQDGPNAYMSFWSAAGHYKLNYNIPTTPHTRGSLVLFRNGTHIAYQNGYKWAIFIEYDMIPPTAGYKKLFEQIVTELELSGKSAYWYTHNDVDAFSNIRFLWGAGPVAFRSNLSRNRMLNGDWHRDSRRWIQTWGLGFGESCIEYLLKQHFGDDGIIRRNLAVYSKPIWGIDNYKNLQISAFFNRPKRPINSYHWDHVHIYPIKRNDDYNLLLCVSIGEANTSVSIKNITVKYDETIVTYVDELVLYKYGCKIDALPNYDGVEKISLSYETDTGIEMEKYEEFFYTKYIINIHNNIMYAEYHE